MIQDGPHVRYPDSVEALLVPLDSVKQHPDNPNNGDLEEIIKSIKVNGFLEIPVVDKATGYIIAGNHRWQALHALGASKIPVVYADMLNDGGDLRYMLASNEIGKLARMDKNLQAEILQKLSEQTELGLVGTGFDDDRYRDLMADLAATAHIPMGGNDGGYAPSGYYQVVIEFKDPDKRDEAMKFLSVMFGDNARSVNL